MQTMLQPTPRGTHVLTGSYEASWFGPKHHMRLEFADDIVNGTPECHCVVKSTWHPHKLRQPWPSTQLSQLCHVWHSVQSLYIQPVLPKRLRGQRSTAMSIHCHASRHHLSSDNAQSVLREWCIIVSETGDW